MSVHHRRYSNIEVASKYVMNNMLLEEVTEIKYLGVLYDSLLIFDKHICEKKNNKAYMMLGIIKRNFDYISRLISLQIETLPSHQRNYRS